MKILISNDDGIMAPGIRVLKEYLEKEHDVYVVAPDVERSATGHAITIRNPLWAKKISFGNNFFGFAVNGTPADCVKLGLQAIYKDIDFDIVISGINKGANLGTDILYSGTVSAALEGALSGKPSIAVSCIDFNQPNFEDAAKIILDILKKLDPKEIPEFTTLNINVPNIPYDEIKGLKITRQSKRRYNDYFEERKDPYGNSYYWMLGKVIEDDDENYSDYYCARDGFVSITPITVFLTNTDFTIPLKNILGVR
ncbi:5'/3'-nucleotidase SurE [Oceanotoga sp. DSM 15011]|jgi:5'-nucleotidase|uniref:5'-nucleotidase SurE n=1 Tax=Oceanotoga teriensis TaxID=515440 RepID=A0AA45C8I7_9BACT|nr:MULTISPECIES: 5'/3'-nucleotidase SurE [Oceanotoga]MDN5341248.1 5/3-nucleotidase [Oceanotoga sp.]MDO7977871.1 5'/3'-nucleotidase SurE [Oceanotoga teriensis]PWJ96008.1 5'-nucleotidase /3'-nucleotidase /exopolyphosphatase [Oceanotoga teriensis]UYP00770.1 5'/3'-nucleotidase SurE [Oceanotoga sp. DSM 15011]